MTNANRRTRRRTLSPAPRGRRQGHRAGALQPTTWSCRVRGTARRSGSTVARGTLRSITLDPGFDWARVVVVTADDIPGENVVQLIRDEPARAGAAGE